ncbi:MAG TPA: hypothetical protein VLE73_02295 [Candidatus Saccharimonadales bacterium]|nr:hypothetical protein [Candidatus Saccharimonadales bacterium]
MTSSLPESFIYSPQAEELRVRLLTDALDGRFSDADRYFEEGVRQIDPGRLDARQHAQHGELAVAYGLASTRYALAVHDVNEAYGILDGAHEDLLDISEQVHRYIVGKDGVPYVDGVPAMDALRVMYRVAGRIAVAHGAIEAAVDVNDGQPISSRLSSITAAHLLLEHTGDSGREDRAMNAEFGHELATLGGNPTEALLWRTFMPFDKPVSVSPEAKLLKQIVNDLRDHASARSEQ